jgi:hypothetical protein
MKADEDDIHNKRNIGKGKERAVDFMDLTGDSDDDAPPLQFTNLISSSAGSDSQGGYNVMQIQREQMKKVIGSLILT